MGGLAKLLKTLKGVDGPLACTTTAAHIATLLNYSARLLANSDDIEKQDVGLLHRLRMFLLLEAR